MQQAQFEAHKKRLEEEEQKKADEEAANLETNKEARIDIADIKNTADVDIDDI